MADNNNNSMPAISLNDLINVARLNYFFNIWMNDARVAQVFKGPKGDKGDPFRYEDFTAEQLADLKKPAEDAAADAEKVNASLDGYILTVTDRHGNSTQMNVKGNFIDWSTMSQADKDLLIQTVANEIKNTFVFATNTVCENIIDEL